MKQKIEELTSAIEEQNDIAEKLLEERVENEKAIKDLKTAVTRLEKAKHELVIKVIFYIWNDLVLAQILCIILYLDDWT